MFTEGLVAGVIATKIFTKYRHKINIPVKVLSLRDQSENMVRKLARYQKFNTFISDKKPAVSKIPLSKIDRDLTITSVSLGLTTVGALLYPPLRFFSIPCLLWISYINGQDAFTGYKKGRGIFNLYMLSTVFVIGTILTGSYFSGSLGAFFVRLSRKMLAKTEDNSIKGLVNIFGHQARTAWLYQSGTEVEVDIESLVIGDVIAIHAGEIVPCDGKIIAGDAEIDERILTGESQPVYKKMDDFVLAATQVISGKLRVQIEKTGKDTVAANIGEVLNETKEYKNQVLSWGEGIADRSACITIILSALTLPVLGATTALTVLNASFGIYMMALGPLSMLNYLNRASKSGILIKDGRSLQLLTEVDTVVFDKTGTLTQDALHVSQIYCVAQQTEDQLLIAAAAAEYRQSHPIAIAIRAAAEAKHLILPNTHAPQVDTGYGVTVQMELAEPFEHTTTDLEVESYLVQVGSARYMALKKMCVPTEIQRVADRCQAQGKVLVYVAIDHCVVGAIELQAMIRPEADQVIRELQARRIEVVILSGDHEQPTQKLAGELGITTYFSETLPEDKAKKIQELQAKGRSVCYVGDGINDAIALKQANVSVSLQGASSIATDVAQIILMKQNLCQLVEGFDMAKSYKNNIKTTRIITTLPGIIIVYGAFFYGFGVLHSVLLNGASLLIGAGNTIKPNVKIKNFSIQEKAKKFKRKYLL